MRGTSRVPRQTGFTLVELMVALGIFLIICTVAFSLLGMSQRRYQSESQVMNSFQEARLALDQIVRDVSASGFPPINQFATLPADAKLFASTPFAWSAGAGYPNAPCQIATGGGGTCSSASATGATPGDFDLIVETNINPQDPASTVQWIRYQLQGTTLYRAVVPKVAVDDPDADTSAAGVMVPYVQNVVNNSLGNTVPIFSYICDTGTVPQPCPVAGASNAPRNIRDVAITLMVQAPTPDTQTGRPLQVELSGRARRINPNF